MILGETYLFAGTTLFIMGINELQNRSKKPDLMVFGAEMMAEAFAMIIRASNAEPSGRRGPYTIEKGCAGGTLIGKKKGPGTSTSSIIHGAHGRSFSQ